MTATPSIMFVKSGNVEIVRDFAQRGVAFLVVGGAAVAVYGCRDFENVDDLDLMIEPSLENGRRVVAALVAKHIPVPFSPEALARPAVQFPIKLVPYWLDILTPEARFEFAGMLHRSTSATLENLEVRVVARGDLIALKEIAAARLASELSKHQRDLNCLKVS